jgi:DNA-binding XRE family transcriptional regulator
VRTEGDGMNSASEQTGSLYDPASVGSSIRRRRKQLGLTLVELAEASDLSQPFLSQVERGRATPSMRSLNAVAAALGTTGPRLLAAGSAAPVRVSRRDDVSSVANDVGVSAAGATGRTRSLAGGDGLVAITEYEGGMYEMTDFFRHRAGEMLYVVRGRVEVELEGRPVVALEERESVAIEEHLGHRWRMFPSDPPAVVILITQPD